MKYYIYCKITHKLLAIYTNKETLKNLDLSRCYYSEQELFLGKINPLLQNRQIQSQPNLLSTHGRNIDKPKERKAQESVISDYLMNPTNPIYHSQAYSSYSSCNSSSYSDSSSSSCSDSSSSSCSSSCD